MIAIEGQAPRIPGVSGTGSLPQGQVSLTPNTKKEDEGFGVIRALDPPNARQEVGVQDERHHVGRACSRRRSDLVFGGGKEGYFLALDARTGALLWKAALGGQINSGPMSYAVNGKQYVTSPPEALSLPSGCAEMSRRVHRLGAWLLVLTAPCCAFALAPLLSKRQKSTSRRAAALFRTRARTATVLTAIRWQESISAEANSARPLSDEELVGIIRNGIPGTPMPASNLSPELRRDASSPTCDRSRPRGGEARRPETPCAGGRSSREGRLPAVPPC